MWLTYFNVNVFVCHVVVDANVDVDVMWVVMYSDSDEAFRFLDVVAQAFL